MIFFTLYGLAIVAISLTLMVSPARCVAAGVRYCEWRFMHPTEILVMLASGAGFRYWAPVSRYPEAFAVFGALLLVVGIALVVTPPLWHRRFGVWSLRKCEGWLRPSGLFSLCAGALIVYSAW